MLNAYRTTDLSLSAFLQARGHAIVEISTEKGRGIFIFEETNDLRRDVLIWGNNQPVPIRVRAFCNGLRDLKGLVGV